ncbi:MAG: cache domain-containing protein, partial [Deltaproteobacteria bacterium]|nr:cache domain-containing protein [Deltaproteobacteria bacterium]
LRATIDTDVFRSLVENVEVGQTGEVYLINQEGIFQTTPRFSGNIMEKAPIPVGAIHEGIEVDIWDSDAQTRGVRYPRQIVATTWLKEPRWKLVVKQDHSEAFGAVNHANDATLVFLHLCALTILIVSLLITRHLVKVIRNRDIESAKLNEQLLQAS